MDNFKEGGRILEGKLENELNGVTAERSGEDQVDPFDFIF